VSDCVEANETGRPGEVCLYLSSISAVLLNLIRTAVVLVVLSGDEDEVGRLHKISKYSGHMREATATLWKKDSM
jgi:hypothetical protein